ncbi:FAEL053Cp [Eremothecium gossypii FDAG1]|nr:FAEL053Cp [Eremothecium gossypii FDAG1]
MNVPERLPLHSDVLQQFHELSSYNKTDLVEEVRHQFELTLVQVVRETPGEMPRELIDSISAQYRELLAIARQMASRDAHLERSKADYKAQSDQCEPIKLQTWDGYQQGELTAPSLAEIYAQEDAGEEARAPAEHEDQLQRLFTALPYIWNDPTAMVPDQAASRQEDEELKISGGTIELTCPITCQPFVRPMISRKCGHVFDEVGLRRFLERQTKPCPQGACGHNLSMKDFVPDLVMQFRCLLHEARGPLTRNASEDPADIV